MADSWSRRVRIKNEEMDDCLSRQVRAANSNARSNANLHYRNARYDTAWRNRWILDTTQKPLKRNLVVPHGTPSIQLGLTGSR
jgi:hypothetical protein